MLKLALPAAQGQELAVPRVPWEVPLCCALLFLHHRRGRGSPGRVLVLELGRCAAEPFGKACRSKIPAVLPAKPQDERDPAGGSPPTPVGPALAGAGEVDRWARSNVCGAIPTVRQLRPCRLS